MLGSPRRRISNTRWSWGGEEVEAFVSPVVVHLGVADLAEELVAVGGVVDSRNEVEVAPIGGEQKLLQVAEGGCRALLTLPPRPRESDEGLPADSAEAAAIADADIPAERSAS